MDDRLVDELARAKFLMRYFSQQELSRANISKVDVDEDWPSSDYIAWNNLLENEKNMWIVMAATWLKNLKAHRPEQYNILTSNWKSIDNE